MTVQGLLLRLHTVGVMPRSGRRFLKNRAWRVECGEAAGLKLRLPQNLEYVRGTSERPLQACIARHLAPGSVFYDIGANVGFFAILAARRVGETGAVHAFEPLAENAAAIRANAALNGFRNVTVLETAVDAASGRGELLLTPWDGGSSLSGTVVAPDRPTERREVRVVALDEIITEERLRPPTLVKIDVEGAELGVLHGMRKTLEVHRPAVVYEVDDGNSARFEHRWRELDEFVRALGYRVTHLESSYPNLRWHVGHSLAEPPAAGCRQ